MTHAEFVESYRTGGVRVHVDRSRAIQLMNTRLPAKRYRAAHLFWTWAWFLSFPVSLVLFIWVKWWAGLVVLIIGLLLPQAIKTSACQFVLEQALENTEFYDFAVKSQTLVIKLPE